MWTLTRGEPNLRSEDESEQQRQGAERVRAHISSLTRAQFQDLTRRLVLFAARLLRGGSLDHHAYEIVTGAIDLALDGTRIWDPAACSFDNFLFGVVRSRQHFVPLDACATGQDRGSAAAGARRSGRPPGTICR